MKIEQVLQLVDAVSDSALTEFKLEEGGTKLCLKKTPEGSTQILQMPTATGDAQAVGNMSSAGCLQFVHNGIPSGDQAEGSTTEEKIPGTQIPEENVVKSPLVGTFYAAPSEDADPFVKVGDQVSVGQVLAIVEAMKLMNDIESTCSGTVAEILVENGEAVEYGQPLFVVR